MNSSLKTTHLESRWWEKRVCGSDILHAGGNNSRENKLNDSSTCNEITVSCKLNRKIKDEFTRQQAQNLACRTPTSVHQGNVE